MGIFDIFKKKTDPLRISHVEPTQQPPSLTVIAPTPVSKINLVKERTEKVKINLSKKTDANIVANVGFCIDVSGSMSLEFSDGSVQEIVERIFPIANAIDSNKALDSWIFSSSYMKTPDVTIDNFHNYVKNEITGSKRCQDILWNGTEYAPVIENIYSTYRKSDLPTYIVFITDGDSSNHSAIERIIKKSSEAPIFYQFVGIGSSSFSFLEKLDNMQGRKVDNANFFSANNISKLTDTELYGKLMNEFPDWLKKVKQMGMIK